jgi:hypothetical protein
MPPGVGKIGTVTAPKLLGIYLNDHLAGADAALSLARRSAGSNARNAVGRALKVLIAEIEEDRAALESIMDRLAVRPDPLKRGAVRVAERFGRLKLNGRLTSYSPLSRLLELEALCLGVEGKVALWRSLQEVVPKLPALAEVDLDELIARAEGQRKTLEDLRLDAAKRALLSD